MVVRMRTNRHRFLGGTFGDETADVEVSGDHISFTRHGRCDSPHWEGTLSEHDGHLKIVDDQ